MTKDTMPPAVMRNALEHMLAQFADGRPAWALFTTFTFSSAFFEGNVLPILAGMSLDELKGSKVVRSELNEALATVRTVVACDRSTNPQAKGDLRYGLLPVGLKAGRFHPKIMLLGGRSVADPGRQTCWICVGSGNLSLSGWAVQREVAGVAAVTPQHSTALRPLIEWLLNQADSQTALTGNPRAQSEGAISLMLRDVLAALINQEDLAPHHPEGPDLHLAWPPALDPTGRGQALLPALTQGEAWDLATVVSPYWGGVCELVRALGVKSCTLVPAPAPDGRMLRPAGLSAGRYRYSRFTGDPQRASHAKAILLSRAAEYVLCIGSANFTMAAWSHGDGQLSNVEAVLRYSVRGKSPWEAMLVPMDEPAVSQQEDDPDAEGAPPLPPFDAQAACDWQARKLVVRVSVHRDVALEAATVYAGEAETRLDFQSVDPQIFEFPIKTLRLTRSFEVRYRLRGGPDATFSSPVLQLNAPEDVLGYRPKPRLSALLQLLRGLRSQHAPDKVREKARREDGSDEGEDADDESQAPSLDLFAFFQATFHMREYFQKNAELDPFEAGSPFGLQVLYRAVALQQCNDDEETIAQYVQLAELLATVDAIAAPVASMQARTNLRTALMEDLQEPEKRVRLLLAASEPFARMFPRSTGTRRSEMLLAWFRQEVTACHA